jgi:lactam utilization protein B
MKVKTICLHGDGAHAIEFAKALHDAFHLQHIAITH